jgi:hypothetical protein
MSQSATGQTRTHRNADRLGGAAVRRVGVQVEVVLVIPLGLVKRAGRGDLGHDRTPKLARLARRLF